MFREVNLHLPTDWDSSSLTALQDHDTEVLLGVAHEFNLSVTAFGKQISQTGVPAYGKLTLSDAWGASLAPAPITPTGTAAPFQILAGTVKATYNVHRGLKDDESVIVSPGHMSGNTGQLSARCTVVLQRRTDFPSLLQILGTTGS